MCLHVAIFFPQIYILFIKLFPEQSGVTQRMLQFHILKAESLQKSKKFLSLPVLFATPADSLFNLKRQIEFIHEHEKYTCTECDKQFSNKYNLTRHIQSIHKQVKYKYTCADCNKQFSEKFNLKQHIQSVHRHYRT